MGIERLKEFWPEWKIEKELGEGAYGKVYSAVREDHSLKSYAAIKVITIPHSKAEISALRSEGLTEEETKAYFDTIITDFVNEIKLMETLKGVTNIVSVEDYRILEAPNGIGCDIFIRMELLTSFAEHLAKHPMSETDVIDMAIDLCSALEVCYKNHIIHRDIKPANIFVSKLGDYKIGDFGVAKELEKTTGAMSAKGTYSYMAPEVTKGMRYDATVDIYSLGLVMYGLLNNNRQPFIDPNKTIVSYNDRMEANDKRLSGEALPPPCNASELTAKVILTACSYDPKKRFSNPTAFKNILKSCKESLNSSAAVISEKKTEEIKTAVPEIDATVAVTKPVENPVQPEADKEPVNDNKKTPNTPKAKKKSKAGVVIAGVLIWLIISAAVVAGAYFLLNNDSKTVETEKETTAESAAAESNEGEIIPDEISVGDIITLGSYEQDNDLTNGAEPVEWIVIDQQDGSSLLLSKYALEAAPFVDPVDGTNVYGRNNFIIFSSLNLIDNNTEVILSDEEFFSIFKIPTDRLRNINVPLYSGEISENSQNSTVLPSTTSNNLFILNMEEAETLLTDEQRRCEATEYAKANGAFTDPYCWWWLEDEIAQDSIANVNGKGEIVTEPGKNITNGSGCIRPAIWINLDEYNSLFN